MTVRACVPAFMTAWLMVAGCGQGTPDSKAVAPKVGASTKSYTLKGVVRKVDAGAGEVSISHEAIPGFMSKMTMPFTLRDKALLEDVRPGDEVEGPLEVEYDGDEVKDMRLADLVVTK